MKKAVFDPTVFGVLGSVELFLPCSGPGVGLGKALLVFSVLLPNTGHSEPPAAAMRPGVTHAHHPSLSSLGFHTPASWSEFISKPGNPPWGAGLVSEPDGGISEGSASVHRTLVCLRCRAQRQPQAPRAGRMWQDCQLRELGG